LEAGANKEGSVEMYLAYIRARLGLGREEGQALVEYALILSLIALLAIGGLTLAGNSIAGMFSDIASKL
jgi:pilus assembly protein Flp/PilA